MDFPSLIHLLATVREIDPDRRIVVFGSSSILASFPETDEKQWLALTNDADFILSPWEDEVAMDDKLLVKTHHVLRDVVAAAREQGYAVECSETPWKDEAA